MPIRRLNYTKRRKLSRSEVRVQLLPGGDGLPRSFDAQLDLPDDLPGDARVFVEAYRSSPAARMRFDFGTVAQRTPPSIDGRRLTEFNDDLPPPQFRVKVTDVRDQPGRLLADAAGIKPVNPDEKPENKRGILLTAWDDNDGLPWRLDLENDAGPLLVIDRTADPFHEFPTKLEFKAWVYPEIIRRVLHRILIEDEGQLIEDDTAWHGQWVRFPREAFGFAEPPPPLTSSDDLTPYQDWIEDAVKFCCSQAEFCEKLAPPAEGDEG